MNELLAKQTIARAYMAKQCTVRFMGSRKAFRFRKGSPFFNYLLVSCLVLYYWYEDKVVCNVFSSAPMQWKYNTVDNNTHDKFFPEEL